jgi:TonB family protein
MPSRPLLPAQLCLAMLAALAVIPAQGGLSECVKPSTATAVVIPGCVAKQSTKSGPPAVRSVKRGALKRTALVPVEPALTPPLTEAEARRALELELSLKVGKHMREADFPDEAQRWRWSGTALVEVLLTAEGQVEQVILSRSSGFRVLDQQAVEVVRRVPRLFVPPQLRGRPQRAIVPITFHFRPV